MAIYTQKMVDAAKDALASAEKDRDNAKELHSRAVADVANALKTKNKVFADSDATDKDRTGAIESLNKAREMEVSLAESLATAETKCENKSYDYLKILDIYNQQQNERRELAGIATNDYEILNHRYTMVGRELSKDQTAIENHDNNINEYTSALVEYNETLDYEATQLEKATKELAIEEAKDEPDDKEIKKHKGQIEESTSQIDWATKEKDVAETSITRETAIRDNLQGMIQPQLDAKTLTTLFETNIVELIGNRADNENAYVNAAKADAKENGWLISAAEARVMTRAYHYSMKDIKDKIVAAAEKGETEIIVEKLSATLTEVLIEQKFDLSYAPVEERVVVGNTIGGKSAKFIKDNWVKISWKFAAIPA